MPPQYVKTNKHDAADAEACCEAVQLPSMRFVAVKSESQQATLMLHRVRDQLIGQRTATIPGLGRWALRGHLADHLFVDVVAVRPRRQRQGLGRRLMAFAAAEARRRGLSEIRLYTHEVMSGALGLYRALGYQETARRLEDGYARVHLRKVLDAER